MNQRQTDGDQQDEVRYDLEEQASSSGRDVARKERTLECRVGKYREEIAKLKVSALARVQSD